MVESDWEQRIGKQRDWVWRGWQVRYCFWRPPVRSSKPPLILLHGFGAAIEHWRHNISVLGQDRMVYALDLLGFGGSRKPVTVYSVDLWTELVYEFWRTFIQVPVVVVGNSLGSLVCLAIAASHPHTVSGIVPINIPDVSLRQATIPKPLQPLVNTIEGIFGSPPILKPLFQLLRRRATIRQWAKVAYHNKEKVTPELVEILAAPTYDEDTADTFCALFTSLRQPQFSPPIQTLLPQINCPILLLWGRQDCMVPFKLAQQFIPLNPNLKFIPLDNTGHCPHDETPEQFLSILIPWLTSQVDNSI
ncbi:alpha/beta fold hydrolase [Spirulina sp. CS-785/01]|uniref:alpha/beta fold hydrolase n=1 Tax=Spirulina sp. CS-785/01 TaxID=3021716 RepID=UPI00232BEBED|nr:alpha/beta fold hydrolase [Spirulina sp. CS-785/01]MDB9313899.1 alpha/beta fold hydrolase [Spirulina sp. CS-785/01]